MMTIWPLGLALLLAPETTTAADVVALRDGKVILGQVVEAPSKAKLTVIVRRAWARAHLPDRIKAWEAAASTSARSARDQRRQRLDAWRRERPEEAHDSIAAWIDHEREQLREDKGAPPPLLRVELDTRQVRKVERRTPDLARLLRQAWRSHIEEPETQPVEALRETLEGRGVALTEVDPAPIDDLLAIPVETDARWRLQRAATEVKTDAGLRFIRTQGLVLPEESRPGPNTVASAAGNVLKGLLGDDAPAEDPLAARLREIAARGRIGAVVTALDIAPDFDQVSVQATLWVRLGNGRWVPALVRPATVRASRLPPNAGGPLAADPQVQAAFQIVEQLGLGSIPADVKQHSLNVGAATRQALGLSQSALSHDIESLALPVSR